MAYQSRNVYINRETGQYSNIGGAGYNYSHTEQYDSEVEGAAFYYMIVAFLVFATGAVSVYMYGSWILYPLGGAALAAVIIPGWRHQLMKFGLLKTLFAVFAVLAVVGAMIHGGAPVPHVIAYSTPQR